MNYFSNFNALSSSPMGRLMEQVYSSPQEEASSSMQAGLKSIARCQLEVWGLASRQTRASLGLFTQLATCGTPQDAMKAYADYWQSVFLDSADTTHRLAAQLGASVPVEASGSDEKRTPVPTILTGEIRERTSRRQLNGVAGGEEARV